VCDACVALFSVCGFVFDVVGEPSCSFGDVRFLKQLLASSK